MTARPHRPSIHLILEEHGWSSLKLKIGDATADIGAFGYCSDAIGDLARAALGIAAGEYRAHVSFDGEPAEWRLIFQRDWETIGASVLKVELRLFPEIYAREPDDGGEILLSETCLADDFAVAVVEALDALWLEHGAEDYRRRWQIAPFPVRALTALKAVLPIEEILGPSFGAEGDDRVTYFASGRTDADV